MSRFAYVLSTAVEGGKFLSVMGLMDVLQKKYTNVGYFKPVYSKACLDEMEILTKHFGVKMSVQDMCGVLLDDFHKAIEKNKKEEILDVILDKFKKLEKKHDFILVEGLDISDHTDAFETHESNRNIIETLSIPVIDVIDGFEKTEKDIELILKSHVDTYKEYKIEYLFSIINRVSEIDMSHVRDKYSVLTLPYSKKLDMPSVGEVKEFLGADVLYGKEFIDNPVDNFLVCAMHLENMLTYLKEERTVLIVPFDRTDVLVGITGLLQTTTFPSIKGIIITGKGSIHENVKKVFDGKKDLNIPIIHSKEETFTTATKVSMVSSKFTSRNTYKIDMVREAFEKATLECNVINFLSKEVATKRTPKMFLYELSENARKKQRHIVLPEGEEPRILRAAENLSRRGLVKLTLLGREDAISLKLKELGIDLKGVNIVEPIKSPRFAEYCEKLYELRKHKGMNEDMAKDAMSNVNYFGTMMVQVGDADGMVSGAIHSTAETIRPALQIIKTKPESSIVSSVFLMCLEDRILVYGDCAVNPTPNAEELACIAIDSEKTARSFGIEPKIAMLSYSTGSSGSGEEVEKVKAALAIVKEKRKDLIIDGPLQYDAAVSVEVGKTKMPNSPVAGQASVLIFPDLNTGNNTYKAVQRETGSLALGPVLQGLRKPINDLSRGCSVDDIVNTVLITSAQCE